MAKVDELRPVDVSFGKDTEAEMTSYVEKQLDHLIKSHRDLHQNRIPRWRKTYLGVPAEDTKSFPWPNAANTVVQVVGEIVDTMVARVLGLLYATSPLWGFQRPGKADDPDRSERERRVLEEFMDTVGYEPSCLDLWRLEGLWFTDAARLGTSFLAANIEERIEVIRVGYTSAKKIQAEEDTLYFGPKVHKVRHEDMFIADAPSLEESEFVARKVTLKKHGLEEKGFTGQYSRKAVDAILDSPDRHQDEQTKREELQTEGIQSTVAVDVGAQWDIFQCFYPWWHNGHKFRIIESYHKKTKTVMRRTFNYVPDNETPIIRARLGYRTDGIYGHGFAELLERYQEELSTVHNQRLDNATAANTRALRVSPRARNLDANIELYPMALLVGEKDEIEALQIADVYQSSFENETVTLGLVQSRAGISPAISGSGAGGPMPRKPGVYGSLGAMATMQESNSRVNMETSDFRHAHVKLGSLITALYGKFGTGGIEATFGLDKDLLQSALRDYAKNRLTIPIRASNASLNRELDRQSDMLMIGLMQRHYTAVSQLLQALNNPMTPPTVQQYLAKVIPAMDRLVRRVLKDFQYDQPDQYIPDLKEGREDQTPKGPGGGQVATQGSPMGAAIAAAAQRGPGMVPAPTGGGIPPGNPQLAASAGGPAI